MPRSPLEYDVLIFAVSNFEANVVSWTIRGALICMFLTFAIRFSKVELKGVVLDLAKSFWLIGSLLSLLHALATMSFHHQFRHEAALADTARQTEALLGFPMGVGIYFNYAFVVVWLIDAFWWNGSAKSYLSRWRWIDGMVYGYLAFIAFNGAIVFEAGAVRWVAIAAVVVLLLIALLSPAGKKTTPSESDQD